MIPTDDRPATLEPAPPELLTWLAGAIADPGRIRTRATDRLALAHDASHFLLVPKAVAVPVDAAEVGRLFAAAAEHGLPLAFRSGGTSLSGQAGTDGVLVDTRTHFRGVEILDDGARVRIGPGATVRSVNARLARHGRKLGPDPASEVACTLGGVVANNSSGMACGTTANSYATLESIVLVLPSGTVVDSGRADADELLRADEPELYAGLARLRDRVRANPASRATIERQFSMKNTMGYGLNSLLDYDRPVDILAHLAIGSEGTLGFIASVVMRTVPLLPHARTGLLLFEELSAATAALPALVATQPATIELLDATSLRVAKADPQADGMLRRIAVDRHAALLLEYQAQSPADVDLLAEHAGPVLQTLPLAGPRTLAADPAVRASLWHIRKGLYTTVAEARPCGTTALLEDVVVPVEHLLPTCEQLTALFAKHGYDAGVIFGHAKDGNVHFMITEELAGGASLDRYSRFTDDMVELILGQGGSLKAEHGTGRIMAPFVRRQYGDELYAVMAEIKRLCDPRGILGNGVLISDVPDLHLRDLKTSPTVEEQVDRCVECGFCEPVCPSRDLTLTPRQRIVLRREIERARAAGDEVLLARLRAEYDYDGIDTCAVDGMCQTACPVLINTGDLVKQLRAEQAGQLTTAGWTTAARHWGAATRTAATALTVASTVPSLATRATTFARTLLDPDTVPQWSADLPRGGHPRRAAARPQADAVWFPSCTGSLFAPAPANRGPATRESGSSAGRVGVCGPASRGEGTAAGPHDARLADQPAPPQSANGAATAFEALCARAGLTLTRPAGIGKLCCGTPWRSKGMTAGYEQMAARVLPALWEASHGGELPVVCDAASCTEGLRQMVEHAGGRYAGLQVVDAVRFTADRLLGALRVTLPYRSLALHPTCASTRMGLNPALEQVAAAAAGSVTVPDSWGCCAFAGDRGLLHPEFTASATAAEAAEVRAGDFDAFASCNRTCELGMTRATGRPYRHVLELLADATG